MNAPRYPLCGMARDNGELVNTLVGPGQHIYLDLVKVRDIAEVQVNGVSAGLTWTPPYRVDVTSVLKPGANSLEIK